MLVKLDTEVLPGSKVKVVLTAEAPDVDKVFAKTYDQIRQQGRIPGFRPGKAPTTIIKRHFGAQLIQEMAWSAFLEDLYLPALEESDLRLAFPPEIPELANVESFAEGETVQIETVVTVHPQPKLPDYKSLHLLKARPEVSDEEIEGQLEQLRGAYADEVDVDRDAVAEGDLVSVAMKVLSPDGEVLEESAAEFIANREDDQPVARKLAGHIIGQTVTDEMTISDEFENPELAGQQVSIEATIESIKERQLPALDDDFAREVDEELESLDALRERIRDQLQTGKARAAERALRNMAVTVLTTMTEIDIPTELIDNVTASQVETYLRHLQGQGLSLEDSVASLKGEQDSVVSDVLAGLRLHYIFEAIAEAEDIEITDEDVEAAIPQYAEDNNLDEQMVRDAVHIHEEMENRLRNFARHEKIIQILIDGAEIEEVDWEAYPLRVRRHMEQYLQAPEGAAASGERLVEGEATEATEAAQTGPVAPPDTVPSAPPEAEASQESEED